MKQTLLMIVLSLIGTVGVFFEGPFIAVAIYYLFAVLRPQYLWHWALPENIAWSEVVAVAAILGAIAYAVQIAPFRARDEPPFRGLALSHKLLLCFGGWVLLSYFTAQDKLVAGIWLEEYFKIFTMFVISVLIIRRPSQVWALYLLGTGALCYIAYEINSLYILDGRLDVWHNGYGGLDNNGAGLMLAMGVPLATYAWEASRRWWRWIFAASIPLLVHAVMMTYSRGAMLSLIVATPLLVLRSRRRWQFALILLLMAFAVPIMAGPEIRARFTTINRIEADASANSRFTSWGAAFRIANDYPVFGVGIRNSNLFSFAYGADIEGRTIHSQYLQILADSGYPALFFYALAILALLVSSNRARKRLKGRNDEEADLVRSMLAGIDGAILVFAFGGAFLSLEVFELPYLVTLLGGQLIMWTRTLPAVAPNPATASRPTYPVRLSWTMPQPGRSQASFVPRARALRR